MIGLSIQFLTGRYHATPWNHQVNEGQVEWPPSPWRILRSLVFAYYHLPEQPERSLFNQILSKLANHLPSYSLPAYVAAHTRHYMPVFREGKSTTTKVFDTFYALPGGALSPEAKLWVMWSGVEATDEESICCAVSAARLAIWGGRSPGSRSSCCRRRSWMLKGSHSRCGP